jgi:hypothetical protein
MSPLALTFGSVQCTPQERPDPIRVASAGSGKKPSATVESRLASSATGTPFAGRRRSHRKWHARSGLAACLVWVEEGDGVADAPTPHPKDCWDNSYSSFQFITGSSHQGSERNERKYAELPNIRVKNMYMKVRKEKFCHRPNMLKKTISQSKNSI